MDSDGFLPARERLHSGGTSSDTSSYEDEDNVKGADDLGDWSEDSSERLDPSSPAGLRRDPSHTHLEAQQFARSKFEWLTNAGPVIDTRRQYSDHSYASSTLTERRRNGCAFSDAPENRVNGSHDHADDKLHSGAFGFRSAVGNGYSSSSTYKAAGQYLSSCARYSLTPNGGSLLCLSLGLEMLEADGMLTNLALVPLCAALLDAPFVEHLKLSGHPVNDTGAAVLALVLPGCPWIKELELVGCGISGVGVQSICRALPKSGVQRLILRKNQLRVNSHLANVSIAHVVERAKELHVLDLQSCGLTSAGMRLIKRSMASREKRGSDPISIAFEGNFVLVEVLNSLTHGACALVCLEAWRRLHGLIVQVCHTESILALTFYIVSMLLMFLGSTLYHSTFAVTDLSWFFKIIDHCAIYFLIAGTYTAVLVMGCRDKVSMEVNAGAHIWVAIYWVTVACGIVMEHVFAPRKTAWYSRFVLCMYVLLGFGGVPYISNCYLVKQADVMLLLELGGLTYVVGIVFFLLDKRYPSMHVIWHIFVGVSAFIHFAAVWNLTESVLENIKDHTSCKEMRSDPLSGIASLLT
jgi:hemolysin III